MWRYLGTAVLLVVLTGCGGASGGGADRTPGGSTPPSSAQPPPLGPVGMARTPDGAVWVAYAASDGIARLDAKGRPGRLVHVGDAPLRIAVLDGSLWVTSIRDGRVTQVDPAAGTVVRSATVGDQPEGIAVYRRRLFVVQQARGALIEVDPATGRRLHGWLVGGEPRLVTAGPDALYVGDNAGGRVARVDAASGRVDRSKAVCAGVQDLQVAGGTVWAACMTDQKVVGLDPGTLRVTASVATAGDPDGIDVGPGGDLVVSGQDGPRLTSVPTDGGKPRLLTVGTTGRLYDEANDDVLVVGSTAYLSDYTGNTVSRVRLSP